MRIDWLPNHVLVMHVLLVFALLNPLVIPFALVYFAVERSEYSRYCRRYDMLSRVAAVVKNQVRLAVTMLTITKKLNFFLSCFMFMRRTTKETVRSCSSEWFDIRWTV